MRLQSSGAGPWVSRVVLIIVLLGVYAGALRLTGQAPGGLGGQGTRSTAREWTQDMPIKIVKPFTLASVGDVIIVRPASQIDDPALQSAINVIRDSDVGFGNFESLIRDESSFQGPLGGSMMGTKEVAADLKAMGFKLMNRAGNHLLDSGEDHPPDFLIELAHAAIDNGADAFVGHGPHLLRGIEIYKGKPIFYDLGEFFREWDWSCDCNFSPNGDVTQAENVVRSLEARGVVEPINYESAVAVSKFDKGLLQEIRIYPIWARQDGPLSRRGLPMTAPPEIARRILQRLQKLSEPFGTKMSIEGNVAVIRESAPPPSSPGSR